MIYIAVDPGNYSGMALYDPTYDEKPDAIEVPYAETGYVLSQWLSVARHVAVDIRVACEVYTIAQHKVMTAQPDAIKGMGVVEYLCQLKNVPLTWQAPTDAKALAPDAELRRLGWYVQTKDGHANDAQRHILRLIATHDPEIYGKLVGV